MFNSRRSSFFFWTRARHFLYLAVTMNHLDTNDRFRLPTDGFRITSPLTILLIRDPLVNFFRDDYIRTAYTQRKIDGQVERFVLRGNRYIYICSVRLTYSSVRWDKKDNSESFTTIGGVEESSTVRFYDFRTRAPRRPSYG